MKRDADFLFVQVGFSLNELLTWRASLNFDGLVYAGVMVIPSASMARKLSTDIPELAIPESIIDRIERDREAGLELACELVSAVRDSGVFTGVHLSTDPVPRECRRSPGIVRVRSPNAAATYCPLGTVQSV